MHLNQGDLFLLPRHFVRSLLNISVKFNRVFTFSSDLSHILEVFLFLTRNL